MSTKLGKGTHTTELLSTAAFEMNVDFKGWIAIECRLHVSNSHSMGYLCEIVRLTRSSAID